MKSFTFLAQAVLLIACVPLSGAAPQGDKDLFKQYLEKFGPPGPEHKFLEPLVGNWHAKVKVFHDPKGQPDVSEGKLVRKATLGGRFVHEDYDGKMMGQPYQGHGMMGFDRATQKWVATWSDSMSTSLKMSRGSYDPSTKTWSFSHDDTCPITKKPVRTRETLRIVNSEEQHLEMFHQMGDAKEMKMMEIHLTRVK